MPTSAGRSQFLICRRPLFDFIHRTLPYTVLVSLTDQDVYMIMASPLPANQFVSENDGINATILRQVKMLDQGDFIIEFLDRI